MNLNLMDPKVVALAVAAVAVIVVAVALHAEARNTTVQLRDRFGPEYDRVVQQHGSERKPKRSWRIVKRGLRS